MFDFFMDDVSMIKRNNEGNDEAYRLIAFLLDTHGLNKFKGSYVFERVATYIENQGKRFKSEWILYNSIEVNSFLKGSLCDLVMLHKSWGTDLFPKVLYRNIILARENGNSTMLLMLRLFVEILTRNLKKFH